MINDTGWRRCGVAIALCMSLWASAQEGPQRLPQIQLDAGIHVIKAELATTPDEREIGLMFRPTKTWRVSPRATFRPAQDIS